MKDFYHQRGQTQTWVTPRQITEKLGPFDLDPCAAKGQPWEHARVSYIERGLEQPWFGRVWLNPPYAHGQILPFIKKFVEHHNGIVLVFCKTETPWFQLLASHADLLFFKRGRIRFCKLDGLEYGAYAGSVFAALGSENVGKLQNFGAEGVYYVRLGLK